MNTKSLVSIRDKLDVWFQHTKLYWGQALEEPTTLITTTDGYYDGFGYYVLEPQRVTRNLKKMYGFSIQHFFVGAMIYDNYKIQSLVRES